MTELIKPIRPNRAASWANVVQDFLSVELMHTTVEYRNESERCINKFVIYLSRREPDARAIAGFPLWLQESGVSASTISKHVSVLKRFLTWCFRMGYTEDRWHEYLPKVKAGPRLEPVIVGQDEYTLLKRMCSGDKDKEFILILGYSTGLRLGDCCMIKWSNIDMEQQVIKTMPSKTSRSTGMTVSIPYVTNGDLHVALTERWPERTSDDDYVCPNMATSYSAHRQGVQILFRRIFNRAGLYDKCFKHFRSTFESRMANSGMNIGLAAKLTGRSDTKTLLRYIKPDMDAARDGIAKALELHKTYPAFK